MAIEIYKGPPNRSGKVMESPKTGRAYGYFARVENTAVDLPFDIDVGGRFSHLELSFEADTGQEELFFTISLDYEEPKRAGLPAYSPAALALFNIDHAVNLEAQALFARVDSGRVVFETEVSPDRILEEVIFYRF